MSTLVLVEVSAGGYYCASQDSGRSGNTGSYDFESLRGRRKIISTRTLAKVMKATNYVPLGVGKDREKTLEF